MTATLARSIERRRFIGLSAGALAAPVAGCRRTSDRAYSRGSKVIIWDS